MFVCSDRFSDLYRYLKANWNAEVKQAWVEAYGAITALMLEGADYSEDEVKL